MLEQKQGQFWNLHEILHRVTPIYIYTFQAQNIFIAGQMSKFFSIFRNDFCTV